MRKDNPYCPNCTVQPNTLTLSKSNPLSNSFTCYSCKEIIHVDTSESIPNICPACSYSVIPSTHLTIFQYNLHAHATVEFYCVQCQSQVFSFENKTVYTHRPLIINNKSVSVATNYFRNIPTIHVSNTYIINVLSAINAFAPNIINKLKTYITFS